MVYNFPLLAFSNAPLALLTAISSWMRALHDLIDDFGCYASRVTSDSLKISLFIARLTTISTDRHSLNIASCQFSKESLFLRQMTQGAVIHLLQKALAHPHQ